MSKAFDMELFLAGVLTGSHSTRQRHLRQAKAIQTAIADRWQRDNPWTWQQKHLAWFLSQRVNRNAESTRYYYLLTVRLLVHRLRKSWHFDPGKTRNRSSVILQGFYETKTYPLTLLEMQPRAVIA